MKISLLFLSLCSYIVSVCGAGGLEVNEAYQLREYHSYADVAVNTYPIPEGTAWALWRFIILTDKPDCNVQNTTVYLQRGGLPVFRPLAEKLPSHFAPDRYEAVVHLSSATRFSHSFDLFRSNPTAGLWFSSAFLVPEEGPMPITQQNITSWDGKQSHNTSEPGNTSCNSGFSLDAWLTVSLPSAIQPVTGVDMDARAYSFTASTVDGFGSQCLTFLKASVVYESRSNVEVLRLGTAQSVLTVGNTLFRYQIPRHVYSYTIRVASCRMVNTDHSNSSINYNSSSTSNITISNSDTTNDSSEGDSNSGSCVFKLYSSGSSSPSEASQFVKGCDFSTDSSCTLEVDRVKVDRWHYVAVIPNDGFDTMQLTMSVIINNCGASPSAGVCSVHELYPINIPGLPYTVKYSLVSHIEKYLTLYDDKVVIESFDTQALLHSGGTIQYRLSTSHMSKSELIRLYSCIQYRQFSIDTQTVRNCSAASNITLDTGSGQTEVYYYIPYPQDGTYYAQIVAECYDRRDNSLVVPCVASIKADVNVSLSPCINTKCGDYGTCYSYYSGVIHWSVCKCKAGYRGIDCSDATYAESTGFQLLQTLFLTLSNLVFLGSAGVAIYMKWFSEAVIYLFVLFSSSFYHACDNGTLYTLCIFDYSLLQYCDFFGSIMAVWVTAMALAEIPFQLRALLHILGFIGILMGTQFTLTGLWTFLVPLLVAAAILATSWIRMCTVSRKCFPDRKIWFWQILPGSVFAIVGVILYSAFETDANYYYVHSLWHILMATAIIFLIPRHDRLDKNQISKLAGCCSNFWRCSFKNIRRRQSVEDIDNMENSSTLMVGAGAGESSGGGSNSPVPTRPKLETHPD